MSIMRAGEEGKGDEAVRDPVRPVDLADGDAFDAFVAAHDVALVAFRTDGWAACAAMEPVLGALAKSSGVAVGVCNPRDDPPLVETYDVRSVPTLRCFVDGDPVARLAEGFQGVAEVFAFLAANLDRHRGALPADRR